MTERKAGYVMRGTDEWIDVSSTSSSGKIIITLSDNCTAQAWVITPTQARQLAAELLHFAREVESNDG